MRYTAIAQVSKALVDVIKQGVVPDLLEKPDEVGLCSPDNHGDFKVGIHLYNIEQSGSFRLSGKQNEGLYYQKYPPVVLDLHYMITPYYKGDIKFLAENEQVMLGRIVQVINDNGTIFADTGEPVTLEFLNPPIGDRQKIWVGDDPYRTSVFISAKAVIVESARESKTSRVTDIMIETEQKKGRKR
jgi:hypothetical protein